MVVALCGIGKLDFLRNELLAPAGLAHVEAAPDSDPDVVLVRKKEAYVFVLITYSVGS